MEPSQSGFKAAVSFVESHICNSQLKFGAWKSFSSANTIETMSDAVFHFGLFAMHVLEVMFFVGLAGSSIVVIISFVEDAFELFGED